jgi:hypothetical protein
MPLPVAVKDAERAWTAAAAAAAAARLVAERTVSIVRAVKVVPREMLEVRLCR